MVGFPPELPMNLTRTDRRPTGDTIGQHWQTLDGNEARREYLLKIGLRVKVPGWPLNWAISRIVDPR